MQTIDQKIVSQKILKEERIVPPEPIEREEILSGSTYKIKYDGHTYYVTINDITLNGVTRPYEVFINSKNVETYTKCLTYCKLISAYLRTKHEYEFIATELLEIIDPKGGVWERGTYVASLEAKLGQVFKTHFERLNQ